MIRTSSEEGVVILNPVSGNANHADAVRHRATLLGYSVRETEKAGDAIALAEEAANEGASMVAAAGGDGTVNGVIRGIDRAGAFEQVTVGIIPAGTGNNFAGNIDIPSIDEGFDVLENGERRHIDLGRADDHLFVNSCVGGLTADASAETSVEMKTQLGTLAYMITTLQSVTTFDGLQLEIDARKNGRWTTEWEGEAICVLVGNARRFSPDGSSQANMEDGLFEVTIIEDLPAVELIEEAVVEKLVGGEMEHVTYLRTPALEIDSESPDPISFSLDGEMITSQTLSLETQPNALEVVVGPGYDPDPSR